MMNKKIMLVFGTRPEAIKMAPLVETLKNRDGFETVVCVTGQHREMLDQVLHLFEIEPDYDLDIMKAGQDLYDVTARVLLGLRDVLKESKPDIVLVHGDTATSTSAALASFYQQIPVGHIEAGLRTHNIYSPWPEEMNRQLTGRLASVHFAPTNLSKHNLLKEGININDIHVTGNTVIDALQWVIKKMDSTPELASSVKEILTSAGIPSTRIDSWYHEAKDLVGKRKLVLITGHRRENFGQGFVNICEAIKETALRFPEVDFVYPMHLNPNVRSAIKDVFGVNGKLDSLDNVFFVEPLDYLPFVYLLRSAYLVLTDSGGIQEEAPGLGKPVLVMRETTERPEALEAGTVCLVGTNRDKISKELSSLLDNSEHYHQMSKANNPYGDGSACNLIIEELEKRLY